MDFAAKCWLESNSEAPSNANLNLPVTFIVWLLLKGLRFNARATFGGFSESRLNAEFCRDYHRNNNRPLPNRHRRCARTDQNETSPSAGDRATLFSRGRAYRFDQRSFHAPERRQFRDQPPNRGSRGSARHATVRTAAARDGR